MLFTEKDIQRILEEVDVATARLVAQVLGRAYLRADDLLLLKRRGVNIEKLVRRFPPHYQSYLFGRISAALGHSVTSTMKYSELAAFLPKMGDFAPTASSMAFYRVAAEKTYGHIRGLGDRIKRSVNDAVSSEQMRYLQAEQVAEKERVIHDEILSGTFRKTAIKKIAANIAEQTQDWNRDWNRIVETECQDVFNLGRAQEFVERSGNPNPTVYFQVYGGACRHCIKLYLTHGIGSQPKLFKLMDLLANGSNYGVKSVDWKPTVHPVHPFCRCMLMFLPEGYVWNMEAGRFEPPKNYVPKVPRKSKVRITIGDRKYEV